MRIAAARVTRQPPAKSGGTPSLNRLQIAAFGSAEHGSQYDLRSECATWR